MVNIGSFVSPFLEKIVGQHITFFGLFQLQTITIIMVLGISLPGLAECFLASRYYEFASKQAPNGPEGLYLGYNHLHTFFDWMFGFILNGHLLDIYCPDPYKFLNSMQRHHYEELGFEQEYGHAHYIWDYFADIGLAAFMLSLIYRWITDYLDWQNKPH